MYFWFMTSYVTWCPSGHCHCRVFGLLYRTHDSCVGGAATPFRISFTDTTENSDGRISPTVSPRYVKKKSSKWFRLPPNHTKHNVNFGAIWPLRWTCRHYNALSMGGHRKASAIIFISYKILLCVPLWTGFILLQEAGLPDFEKVRLHRVFPISLIG